MKHWSCDQHPLPIAEHTIRFDAVYDFMKSDPNPESKISWKYLAHLSGPDFYERSQRLRSSCNSITSRLEINL